MFGHMRKDMVPVTTTIPREVYLEAKTKGLPLQHIFMRGWLSLNGEPQLVARIRELEETQVKLNKIIDNYRTRLFKIETEKLEA